MPNEETADPASTSKPSFIFGRQFSRVQQTRQQHPTTSQSTETRASTCQSIHPAHTPHRRVARSLPSACTQLPPRVPPCADSPGETSKIALRKALAHSRAYENKTAKL